MGVLGETLDYFCDIDDDEILRLFEQGKAIYARMQGDSTVNVAACEIRLGQAYYRRAARAHDVDLDREQTNLELSLSHYGEAGRIYHAINHVDKAENTTQIAVGIVKQLRQLTTTRATGATKG